ncbi:MAG TPA: hypothetical protein PLH22_02295 [Candidatus Colwellbacteria bacterium]|nr:hypothetical protein [Candidatus Colwellbacteria bacterium]
MDDAPKPRVGIGVMIFKNGKVLLGKRKGSHGEGEYAFPGGISNTLNLFPIAAAGKPVRNAGSR